MALSKDEQDQLDALTAKASEPDSDDDYEIELFTPEGHGARVPYRKGRSYLQTHFGIDLDPDPAEGANDDGNGGDASKNSKGSTGKTSPAGKETETKRPTSYFSGRGKS